MLVLQRFWSVKRAEVQDLTPKLPPTSGGNLSQVPQYLLTGMASESKHPQDAYTHAHITCIHINPFIPNTPKPPSPLCGSST